MNLILIDNPSEKYMKQFSMAQLFILNKLRLRTKYI